MFSGEECPRCAEEDDDVHVDDDVQRLRNAERYKERRGEGERIHRQVRLACARECSQR